MAITALIKPEMVDPEITEPRTGLMAYDGGLPSLDRMRERIQHQKAMRALLIEYVKSEMKPEQHFYTIPGSAKPGLSQDGARMLCTLYEVHAEDTHFEEVMEPDGHYTVRATVKLRSMATGVPVAEGTGRCSTHESKYAYRWMWERDLPSNTRKADLERRERGKNSWQYKVPNPDLADGYNTVLKMAEKRAQTAAVLRLPCAPDVFSEPGNEEEEREKDEAADRKELVGLIVKWAKTLPAGTRNRAFEAIWGTPYEKISGLSLTDLDTGFGIAEQASAAGIDWKSRTLKNDLAALQRSSADQAKADLYGDPQPDPTAHVRQETAQDTAHEEGKGGEGQPDLWTQEEAEARSAE